MDGSSRYYILYGDDEFSRAEALAHMRALVAGGDPALTELNTTILDGKQLTIGELRHHCEAIPFMAQKRLVIVNGLLVRLSSGRGAGRPQPADASEGAGDEGRPSSWKRDFVQALIAYLPKLPDPTRLVFVEGGTLKRSHPVLKFAISQGEGAGAHVREFRSPTARDLPRWIQERARAKGGELSGEAVALLATLIGADLRLLDQELEKLTVYANGQLVSGADVRALVSRAREASIFELVDCLGRRTPGRALHLLQELLDDGKAPLYVLSMLVRQIRILIQVSELRDRGLTEQQMAKSLGLHPYAVQKAKAQSHQFDMQRLEAAHDRLVQTDWAIKTGEIEDTLALHLLVVDLTRG